MTLPAAQSLKERGYDVAWSGAREHCQLLGLPAGRAPRQEIAQTHDEWLAFADTPPPTQRYDLAVEPSGLFNGARVISPWAASREKRLSPEHVDRLQGDKIDAVVGPRHAEAYLRQFARDIGASFVSRDDRATWLADLASAKSVVSADTGAMHAADALGVSTVGVFTTTDATRYRPYWSSRQQRQDTCF